MYIDLNKDVKGKELDKLLNILFDISDSFSLGKVYKGLLTIDEFSKLQEDLRNVIEEEYKQYVVELESGEAYALDKLYQVYGTKEKILEVIQSSRNQILESTVHLKYEDLEFEDNLEDYLIAEGLIKYNITRKTPVTTGPIYLLQYFNSRYIFDEIKKSYNSLFQDYVTLEGTDFEDLAFYKDNIPIFAICSHECFGYLKLNKASYDVFAARGGLDIVVGE